MRQDLDDALVRDFPNLYRDRHGDTRHTRMCDGFSCGDGWEPLIRRLSAKLEPLVRGTSLRAAQVKQKFGPLRFYMTPLGPLPPTVEGAIEVATVESERTCERCGDVGRMRDVDSFAQTLCAPCFDVERRASRA